MTRSDMQQPIQAHRATLRRYLDELEHWNSRINLTAIPAEERWVRHIDESARLLAVASPAAGAAVVDVGSGSGAPGLVAAILRPDLRITLLEADSRKAAFLDHASGSLGLTRVRVEPRRAEDAGHDPELRERFDLALARAVAAAPVLCELALPFLLPGGSLVALVGDAGAAAQHCRAASAALGGGEPVATQTDVLIVPKLSPTAEGYPRRAGRPQRHPVR